jgi:hypothetical protein
MILIMKLYQLVVLIDLFLNEMLHNVVTEFIYDMLVTMRQVNRDFPFTVKVWTSLLQC